MKFLIVFLFSLCAWAGNEKGNGGNFLACVSEGKTSYTLVDFYENKEVDLNTKISSWQSAVKEKLTQIQNISPLRGASYFKILEAIVENAQYVEGGYFSSSDDLGPVVIPQGCSLVQAATQFSDRNISEHQFYINSDVWNQISEFQKAGLVLHEIILNEAVASGHKTSKRARKLNGKIWSNELLPRGLYFHEFLEQPMGFRFADRATYWMELFDDSGNPRKNEFWPNGQPWRIFSRKGFTLCVQENCWVPAGAIDSDPDLFFDRNGKLTSAIAESGTFFWNGQQLQIKGQIGFFANGSLFKINLASPLHWLRGSHTIKLNQFVMFYPNQAIETFSFPRTMALPVKLNGPVCIVGSSRPAETISFHPNGIVKEAFLSGICDLQGADGKSYSIQNRTIHIDEYGLYHF